MRGQLLISARPLRRWLMNKMKKALLLAAAAAVLVTAACEIFSGTIRDGARTITIDIDNDLYLEPDAANAWEQGPGVDSVSISIVLDTGDVQASLAAADVTAGDFTQLSQEVTGVLERVDVTAVNAAGVAMAISIDDTAEHEHLHGWEIFANLQRFRIGFNGDSADDWASGYLTLDIAPTGGTGIRYIIDSGAVASPTTDWGGDPLTSKQLAVEPVLSENPVGLTFDIYTVIVGEDLRELYKPGYTNPDADYEHFPWADVWTFDELTSTGKQIGDTVYTMTKYNAGDPLNFAEPLGDGYKSFLIDLSTEADDPVGKYLMFALVSHYDVLSVPASVEIVEIE